MSQQINLYNPALLPKVDVFSGRMMLLTLGGLFVLMLLVYGWTTWDASRLSQEQNQAQIQLNALQADVTRLAGQVASRKPSPQLSAELESLNGLLAGRNEVMAVLKSGVLGDTRGVSEYFRAFARQTMEGLWLTGFSIVGAGNDISIEGRTLRAELVPGYVGKLGHEEVLRGRGFGTLSVQKPPTAPSPNRKTTEFLDFRLASQAPAALAAPPQGSPR